MKKIILSAVVAAAAIFGGFTANQTSSEVAMSDLQVENVEILAEAEYMGGAQCRWDGRADCCTKTGTGSVCVGVDENCKEVIIASYR